MKRETRTTCRVVFTLLLGIPSLVFSEPPGGDAGLEPAATRASFAAHNEAVSPPTGLDNIAPWISGTVPGFVRAKLESGFALAVRKVLERPQCRDLFTNLGTDGVKMLETTLYYPAELKLELRLCPNAYAYTLVGGAPTWLCRRFSRLSDKRAAGVLLHEALHKAGLDESHDERGLMSPRQIDDLVSTSCGI